ncbi:glycosyltransferase [Nocardioides sp. MAH-18]|uniref:Glycosyltransferase n=1 Tax=Nocardioides agri TaxID=2682843 RepID=A0A6L6XSQ5_9ACTN|nr:MULTISPECIES: CDP-glycerol glycerophosphotransferase family protein [unclassified Nocardioides]MBA2955564.1 CDP-glycerol glycerophosphotransferase family protein [Nocardioides sp. CGMCC 1.13656]MVQ50414.1 glycosyltransferase [Nocardioides sp. MAH-18]
MPPAAPRRLGTVVRGVRGRLRSAADPAAAEDRPTLTVVIPVYNVAQYLPECLDSVLGQSFTDLEVIAVDDGSTDGCPAVLAAYAARDPRLRVLRQENAGQGPARNRALEVARGEYVTFCDSDDTVPRRAYEHMVRTLRRTGSDFVVGAARRVKHDKHRHVAWGETVHEFDRLATTIDEFPAAMQDIIACNRMFRTEFWRTRVGGFRGGIAYEDHVPMLTAYVRAERFDVLARVTYNWRLREDHTSTGQQKATLRNLRDRIEVKEEAHALLRAEASEIAYDAWVGRCLDVDFPPFLTHALGGDHDYRAALAATYRTFLERATERALEHVRHDRLVEAWLCAGEHWDALATADEWFGRGRDPQVRVAGGHLMAVPELPADVVALVPDSAWILSPAETTLRAALRSVRRTGETIRVTGYALVPGLATEAGAPDIAAWLVDPASGATRPLAVEPVHEPEIDTWVDDEATSYPHSGFAVILDLAALAPAGPDPVAWRLRVRVEQEGVVRESAVHDAVEASLAAKPRHEVVELGGRRWRLEPRFHPAGGFEVAFLPATLVVGALDEPTGGPMTLRLDGELPPAAKVVARVSPEEAVEARPGPDGTVVLDLPVRGDWALRVSGTGLAPQPLLWPVPGPDPEAPYGATGPGRLVWRVNHVGMVRAVADGRQVRIRHVELRPGAIVTEVVAPGITEAELRGAVWRGRHLELRATDLDLDAVGGTTLTTPVGAAPSGPYLLIVRTADGVEIEAVPDDALGEQLPGSQRTDELRLSLRMRADRTVAADIAGPLTDEERSPAGQEALRRAHRARAVEVGAGAVLLTSDGGRTPGLLALDRELARTRPEVTRYWAVRDLGVAVPEGATPVLAGSRHWHDVLSTAGAVLACGDLPDFFVPSPGQRVVQAFAGFPAAAVGRSFWRSRGLSERAVALELARRRQQWHTAVAPHEDVAAIYRTELDLPEVLVTGHPRYDLLVDADRAAAGARVRARLGLSDDAVLSLYAPAFRDRATRARVKDVDELDLQRLAEGLGRDHVVLALGVPYAGGSRVVDVTTYADVSDLLLAADAAVLDYSDLRFDWALTGRPAVFHVPDHDDYLEVVRPPLDFDSTAVGPQVADVDDLVDALRDRAALRERYDAEVAAFNAKWHAHHDGRAAGRVLGLV